MRADPAVLEIARVAKGEVVPMPREPAKVEVAVVVERREPTVNWLVVAIMTPEELVVTTELIGRVAREEKGTLETVRAPEELVKPVPKRLLKEELLTMRLVVEAVIKEA